MNKLMAKIDTNEELDYNHNSFHSLSESYQLHAEFRRKNDLDIVSSNNVLFYWKLKDLSSDKDIFHIKAFFPDQVLN